MLTDRILIGTLACAVSMAFGEACATRAMASGQSRREVGGEVAITISNEMSRAMRIYLHAGSADLPLGTVPPLAARTFFVPSGFTNGASEFQIEARARGAEVGMFTERFTLGPRRAAAAALRGAGGTAVTVR